MPDNDEVRGWHSRGYIPHFDVPGLTQSVTCHLADSIPRSVIESWQGELRTLSDEGKARELARKIEHYLDAGHGECHLAHPGVAQIVQDALLHFDGDRYRLHDWVIMPNHIHVLVTVGTSHTLGQILQIVQCKASQHLVGAFRRLLDKRVFRSIHSG